MSRKDNVLFVRTSEGFKKRIKAASDVLEKDVSVLVREFVEDGLRELAKTNRKLKRAIREAEAA